MPKWRNGSCLSLIFVIAVIWNSSILNLPRWSDDFEISQSENMPEGYRRFDFQRRIFAILWLVSIATSIAKAHLDFFIGKDEMQRLMAVQGELWYVERGVIDRAAVNYEMQILPQVERLYFSWINRGANSIPYSITISTDPPQSPEPPIESILSIPSTGVIEPSILPSSSDDTTTDTNADVISIRLPSCDAKPPIDRRIRIRFVFDWPSPSNRTEFELRRVKRCSAITAAKSEHLREADGMDGSGESDDEKLKQTRSEDTPAVQFLGSATNVFYVAMGCLFGVMIMTASLITLYFSKADQGMSCCGQNDKTKGSQDADDAGSSLLPPARRSQMCSSTPLNRQSAALAFERGYGESGGSVSSSSGVANAKQSRRSASPSVLSKCTSGAGATSFISAANGNSFVQANPQYEQQPQAQLQPQPQQQPTADTLPRVLRFNEPRPLDLDAIVKRLMVDKTDLEFGQVLLEGTFGEVCIGRLKGRRRRGTKAEGDDAEDTEWENVIVKSVKEKASAQQVSRFLQESLRFIDLPPQPNIALPTAVSKISTDGEEDENAAQDSTSIRYAVCFQHDGYGNLKKFLLRCRGADSSAGALGPPPMVLSTQDLVYAALQIIRGLLHLHKFRLLHRDVAVRNCLVGHDLTIQICDTGLARDLFPQDYHCLGDNENRPIKWLSFESLERSEFSTASDVWAFGVTLWELTTLAQQPYADVDPFEMQAYLSSDQRLLQPYNCPDELYLLMYCCWNLHAEARPTFAQLLSALEHFYAQLTQYI